MLNQHPSLEEIYDYDTNFLIQFLNTLQKTTYRSEYLAIHPQDHAETQYQTYMDYVKTEIEERKTIEFFNQNFMKDKHQNNEGTFQMAYDDSYLKRINDNNKLFIELAGKYLDKQEQGQVEEKGPLIEKESVVKTLSQLETDNEDKASKISLQTESQISKCSEKTTTDYSNMGDTVSKKMGIGRNIHQKIQGKHKSKNQIKQNLLDVLTKNKVEGCYTVTKGANTANKPQISVNQRGHLVRNDTMEPVSHKSIKSQSTNKDKLKNNIVIASSQKEIHKEREIDRKKIEAAFEKTKAMKVSQKGTQHGKKDAKANGFNQMLVDMVRNQETKKIEKEAKGKLNQKQKIQRQYTSVLTTISITEKKDESDKSTQKIHAEENNKKDSPKIKQNEIHLSGKSQQTLLDEKQIIEQRIEINIQDEIQNEKEDQLQKKQDMTIRQQIECEEKGNYINQKYQEKLVNDENIFKKNKTNPQSILYVQNNIVQCQKNQVKQKLYSKEREQLESIKQSLRNEKTLMDQIQQFQKYNSKNQCFEQKDQEIKAQENKKWEEKLEEPQKQTILKRCYNEQYWIHVRQEAEMKIKRFKEEKQLQKYIQNQYRNQNQLKDPINKDNRLVEEELSQQKYQENVLEPILENKQEGQIMQFIDNQQKSINVNSQKFCLFVCQRSESKKVKDQSSLRTITEAIQKHQLLKKMVLNHQNRQKALQKNLKAKAALPDLSRQMLHAKPEYNYLELYPTFNHIFTVMYSKPENQAISQLPVIMKDISQMFSSHLEHFKNRNNVFQPALFMPFDSTSNLNLSDPKQLLLHAENTYVNLKKIIERLEVFNANLHGQFHNQTNQYYRVVKTKEEVYDIITTSFLRRKGWKELPHGCSLRSSWNLFWSWSKPDIDLNRLLVFQKVNHFPFNKNLSRKDLLYKNLDSFRRSLKVPFNFLPLTYNLPKQFTQFSMKFHEEELLNRDCNYWIMKPIGKSRGRGIKVINSLSELNYIDNIVVQKYIANPMLLDGYKFDMRIYVLVTNFHPLEAFIYKEGFARLSTEKFSMEPMFIKNTFVHLTNFAINKNNTEAKQSAAFSGGSKISLKSLKDKLSKMGHSFTNIWSQVHEIIIKSLIGCSVSVPTFPTAFELFGYDIMIDDNEACHLIEINASPSLERSYFIDEIIKQSLIDDILDIVHPVDFSKEALLDIIAERTKYTHRKYTSDQDNLDIARVVQYQKLRKIGEMPEKIGLFQMAAPSKMSLDLEKLIKGKSGANNPKNID